MGGGGATHRSKHLSHNRRATSPPKPYIEKTQSPKPECGASTRTDLGRERAAQASDMSSPGAVSPSHSEGLQGTWGYWGIVEGGGPGSVGGLGCMALARLSFHASELLRTGSLPIDGPQAIRDANPLVKAYLHCVSLTRGGPEQLPL